MLALVLVLWLVAVGVIGGRAIARPERKTTVHVYRKAGEKWIAGKKLYRKHFGFVYSPLVAAGFAPAALVSNTTATVAWAVINAGAVTGAVAWWLRAGLHRGLTRRHAAAVFLLLLPLSIGNLNIAQINPLLIALIMVAVLAARTQRWLLAAIAIALATSLKIYPLAIGLLLVILYPRQLGWRLALAVSCVVLLPFCLQEPSYVAAQYRLWIETRIADNRLLLEGESTCRDLLLVFRALNLPMPPHLYTGLQIGSGIMLAGLLWSGRRRGWGEEELLSLLFTLGCGWMVLLGPATESATYMILAPAAIFALVQAYALPQVGRLQRSLLTIALGLLLLQLVLNAFFRIPRTLSYMAIQPLGALILCGTTLCSALWLFKRRPLVVPPSEGKPTLLNV